MNKRLHSLILTFVLVLGLVACAKAPTWQEQYDLGVRYLSEGNYQEAIIAFTAAIEIDPKQAVLYIGRADAYIGSGETEENLAVALADYERAVALDETNADAWLGLADVYIRRGEYDKAFEILKQSVEKVSDAERIERKLSEMEAGTIADSSGKTRRSNHMENGVLEQYWLYEYDENGNNVKTINYAADGTLQRIEESLFNDRGLEIRSIEKNLTTEQGYTTTTYYDYDDKDRCIKETIEKAYSDGNGGTRTEHEYSLLTYDEKLFTRTENLYNSDGELQWSFVIEHDENWVKTRGSDYRPIDGSEKMELNYYVEYIWNDDGTYGGYNLVQVAPERT